MKTDTAVHIKGLSASFVNEDGAQGVIHDLNIEVPRGKTLAIVGESGSGKSVSSLSIMRLISSPPIRYDKGEILYSKEEIDLLQSDPKTLKNLRGNSIAMIFQEPMSSLNPIKKCGQQVDEAILTHNSLSTSEARDKTLDLFEQVRLPDPLRAYESYPHELSGGQLQRVVIAMAISCEPDLLIADEPTTALDVTVQRDVIELLQSLQKSHNMTLIFISHDLAVVSQIADQVIVMKQGRIIEQGTADLLLNSPQEAYTKGLLASRPPLDTRPRRLPTVADFEHNEAVTQSLISGEERAEILENIYSQPPILSVEDLHTWYPIRAGLLGKANEYVKAVNGVSFALHPGETLGIVGESGCGKSTLGRTVIGLEQARNGKVLYKGKERSEFNATEKKDYIREVQMIFQDPYSSLNPRVRIGEAILEPMTVHGVLNTRAARKEKVLYLLERVGLEAEHFNRYPHEFSGGQRQRICIARTLGLDPKVVICDESVSALDVSVQAQVLNLLNDLKEEFGLSYLFISHDLSVVRYMSDRIAVMNKGQIEEYGEADMVYSEPKAAYTQKLIDSVYTLEAD